MYKLLFSLLIFYSSVVFSKDQISIPFTEENARYWQYISDQTMGGVSDGQAILDKEGDMIFARLTGNVSTANNGGFIQIRTNFSFVDLINTNKDLKGVLLNTKGNGETYHIFIRTSEDRSYRDFYSATFTTNDNWEIVDLPFSKFKHRYSNRSLDGNDIRTFGIVAYGRNFYSDVSVSEISFYD
ncbi:CIA30 family protein [Alphaproteobacteria bacterium]|nr:CIA30 family protein [Alphaproteobacteria bacterium]